MLKLPKEELGPLEKTVMDWIFQVRNFSIGKAIYEKRRWKNDCLQPWVKLGGCFILVLGLHFCQWFWHYYLNWWYQEFIKAEMNASDIWQAFRYPGHDSQVKITSTFTIGDFVLLCCCYKLYLINKIKINSLLLTL